MITQLTEDMVAGKRSRAEVVWQRGQKKDGNSGNSYQSRPYQEVTNAGKNSPQGIKKNYITTGRQISSLPEYPNDSFKADVRKSLLGVAAVMGSALRGGIEPFYRSVETAVAAGPDHTWQFMLEFTQPISNLGPGLMPDFLKNIGFPEFVKIDQRLKKEFPALIPGLPKDARGMFIFAVELCRQIEMTPFVFDHILYQWGNVKTKAYLGL